MTHAPTAQREAVAAEVRAWMGRRRTTQTDLAAVLDMSQPAVSRRLNGDVPFDVDELSKLADLFDVEVTALFARPSSAWDTADELRSPLRSAHPAAA